MPTSMSLGDIVSPSIQAGNSVADQANKNTEAMSNVMAQMQSVQNMKAQQANLQQQLTNGQWASSKDLLNTYMNASTGVRSKMKKQIGQRLQQNGADPLILDSLDDENMQQNYKTAMGAFGNDPDAAAKGMAILGNVSAFESNATSMADMVKQRTQMQQQQSLKDMQMQHDAEMKQMQFAMMKAIADSKNKTNEDIAKGHDASREKAAQARFAPGSPQATRVEAQIMKQYESQMKPYESTLNAVDQLKSTLADVDSGKLSDAKNVKAEIESKMASVFGGGKPSTVFGQQAVGLDSSYGDFQNHMNHIFGEAKGVLTDAQKKQLHQELDTFGGNAAKQHEDAFLTHRELVNPAYTGKIDNAYARYRGQKGLQSVTQYDPSLSPPTAQGTSIAPPAASPAAGQAPAPKPLEKHVISAAAQILKKQYPDLPDATLEAMVAGGGQ